MNPILSAAQELGLAVASLLSEIDKVTDPPSQSQIDNVQLALDKAQRSLNSIQTATDTWSDFRETG